MARQLRHVVVALQPFAQVENALTKNHEGTGLGLPLARQLIQLHGGSMVIESAKGFGTTVRITVPPGRVRSCPDPAEAPVHSPC